MKIFVTAKPNAKIEKVEKIDETHFVVSVKEPPVDGKANAKIEKVLAKFLGIAPSCVEIISGHTSRYKILNLDL